MYSPKDLALPKLSDAESLKTIPEAYFSSTSYNSYLESGSMIRVDTLFKPLLRRFRAHFRTRFDENHNKRMYHRWSNSNYEQHVRTFMQKILNLPK